MSPELLQAVKERIELGYDDDRIREELRQAGYGAEIIEQVLQDVRSGRVATTLVPPATAAGQLPGARKLVTNSLSFLRSRLDLAAMLAVPLVVMALVEPLLEHEATGAIVPVLLLILLLGGITYFLFLIAVLRVVVSDDPEVTTFAAGLTWARGNFLGLLWVQILTGLVTMGGLLLFIIPGIILSLYTYFSQFVYAKEGTKGMQALLRSRDLVKGRWWAVFFVLFKVGLLILGIFLLLGIVAGIAATAIPENAVTVTLGNVLIQLFSAAVTLMSLHIGLVLFNTLAAHTPAATATQPAGGYTALACLGLLFPILLAVSLAIAVAQDPDFFSDLEYELESEFETEKRLSDEEAKQRAIELRELE